MVSGMRYSLLLLVLLLGCADSVTGSGFQLPEFDLCPPPWHRCGSECWPGGQDCDEVVSCGDSCWACGAVGGGSGDGLVPWCLEGGVPTCCPDSAPIACADGDCAAVPEACGATGLAEPPAACADG